jgi:hypothetical protein
MAIRIKIPDCVDVRHGGEPLWHWWIRLPKGDWRCVRCLRTVRCDVRPPTGSTVEKIRADIKSGEYKKRWRIR